MRLTGRLTRRGKSSDDRVRGTIAQLLTTADMKTKTAQPDKLCAQSLRVGSGFRYRKIGNHPSRFILLGDLSVHMAFTDSNSRMVTVDLVDVGVNEVAL